MSGMASTHRLPVELQHQPQRGVRGRVLRAEVHRPQVRLRLVVGQIAGMDRRGQWHVGIAIDSSFELRHFQLILPPA